MLKLSSQMRTVDKSSQSMAVGQLRIEPTMVRLGSTMVVANVRFDGRG